MIGMSNDDLESNWLWVGSDSRGMIALFQTFGTGALPRHLVNFVDEAVELDEFVSAFLEQSGIKSSAIFQHENNRRDSWKNVVPTKDYSREWASFVNGAERTGRHGLFYYLPCCDESDSYYQVVAPSRPLLIGDLTLPIQAIVSSIVFHEIIMFPGMHVISAKQITG
jgi:hypothetical protein